MSRDKEPPSLAVLIDADNTSPRHARAIFEEIATLGEATVRRIYGDFSGSRLAGWNEAVQALAILQHQQRSNTTGKNASDIALVIDAMDLMHKGKLDGVCLISSDSDFTRLAQRLREDGLTVYGFGERKTPEAFRSACNRFIYVENLGAAAGEQGPEAAAPPRRKEPVARAAEILRRAMAGLEDEDGWVALGGVGSRIANVAPDFDPRTYGFGKLSALAESCEGFELRRDGGNRLMIRLAPAAPPPAPPAAPAAPAKPRPPARRKAAARPKAEDGAKR